MSECPNIGADLLRIHSIITRGLNVATENCQCLEQHGDPDASLRAGFISYVRALASVLHAHHLTEDELAFPYFRGKLPDAPYDLLMAQHQQIVLALGKVEAALEEVAAGEPAGESLDKLSQALRELAGLWHPHIQIELDHFSVEKLGPLLDSEEHASLGQACMQHSQQHSGPDFLVVPFLLYNLPPQERVHFAREMPPIVTEQLVPGVWKEHWAPMTPFLLS